MGLPTIYNPCPCQSGKKYKFCCYKKEPENNHVSVEDAMKRVSQFPLHSCEINDDWQEKGLATVLITRALASTRYITGIFLVDTFCLGLKDTFVRILNKNELEDLRLRVATTHEYAELENISYEESRSLILGAIEYAKNLGFKPHEDWSETKECVEGREPFTNRFEFGKDGEPLYIEGPHDDVDEIFATLAPLINQGKAHFMTEVGF